MGRGCIRNAKTEGGFGRGALQIRLLFFCIPAGHTNTGTKPLHSPRARSFRQISAGLLYHPFSIMISSIVRSVCAMPGLLTRPMLRIASSGVPAQIPSVG